MGGLRLLMKYASASIRAQAQYPASTAMLVIGRVFATLIEVLGAWALFDRFGSVQGWTFGDIALFYGLVSIQFVIAEFLTRSFDTLGHELLRTGVFDRLLLRPRSIALQLMGHDLRLTRLGRLVAGGALLVVATRLAPIDWSIGHVAMALWSIAGGAALFYGIVVLQGTMSFWTIESLEIANVFTYGGVEAAQFPLAIYERWFRNVLTYLVPLACVAYFPVLVILDKADPLGTPMWFGVVAPAAGFVFLWLSFIAWGLGLRHYASSGS
jgi:ABC-2 type transport system permease protein